MPKGEIIDKDMGWAKLHTAFEMGDAGQSAVFVGYLRSSGVYKNKEARGGQPITMATLAGIHEFGAPNANIPERSFMRSAVDGGANKITDFAAKLLAKVIVGEMPRKAALGALGQFVKQLMQKRIRTSGPGVAGPWKGLEPETIRRKGSSKPLIDTGQLINAIDFEVVGK